jgi:hypothetical protein
MTIIISLLHSPRYAASYSQVGKSLSATANITLTTPKAARGGPAMVRFMVHLLSLAMLAERAMIQGYQWGGLVQG